MQLRKLAVGMYVVLRKPNGTVAKVLDIGTKFHGAVEVYFVWPLPMGRRVAQPRDISHPAIAGTDWPFANAEAEAAKEAT